jgi:Uma2 family endonuclease
MQAVLEVVEANAEVALDPDRSYEFVNGEWEVKEMPGAKHAGVSSRIDRRLGRFVEDHQLGEVYVECSFQIGNRERVPDLAFLSAARIPPEGEPDTKWPMVPDIAIEVISPTDLYRDVQEKMEEYLAAGVKQVWHVEPERRTITIHRSRIDGITFPVEAELTCEDLLPGFRLPLQQVFRHVAAPAQS